MVNVRKEALKALLKVTEEGAYASLVIRHQLKDMEADERSKKLFTNLVYTTLRYLEPIDAVLKKVSATPLGKMDPYVLSSLRLGVCQLWYMDGIKPYAAVNETVALVKRSKFNRYSAFCNAVLRAVQKEEAPRAVMLPGWVRQSLTNDYGETICHQIADAVTVPKKMTLRVNTLKEDLPSLLSKVNERVAFSQGTFVSEVLYLEEGVDLNSFDLYEKGLVTAQDEGSCLAAVLSGVKPGMKVLDLCAAPGGKSTMMAQIMKDQGSIISRDIFPQRVELIKDNARRLGCTMIQAEVSDGTLPKPEDTEAYDLVFLDAPCSGLGILRSRPDVALNHRPEDIEDLSVLQKKLLETAAKAVKKGGILLYSTCTLSKKENDFQIDGFLKNHPEFELQDLGLEPCLRNMTEADGRIDQSLTLWPNKDSHDGFFVARMIKQK